MSLPARFTQSLLNEFEPAYAHLLRVARRSTGCAETARDLVHDAWVRLAEQTHAAQAPAADAAPGVQPEALRSQGKHTPFGGHEMPVRVRATLVAGQVAHELSPAAALA